MDDLRETILKVQATVSELQPKVDDQRVTAANAEALIETVDQFLTAVHQVDEAGLSPAAVAAVIHDACGDSGDLHVLYVAASQAGGESIYEERWGVDKALHVGGVAITWMFVNGQGQLVSSGVHSAVGFAQSEVGRKFDWRNA